MEELSLLAQATIVLTLALAAARLAQRAPAAVRALLMASTFAVLALLPVAALTVPKRTIEIAVPGASSATPFVRDDVTTAAPARTTEEAVGPISPSPRMSAPTRLKMGSSRDSVRNRRAKRSASSVRSMAYIRSWTVISGAAAGSSVAMMSR
jgi:hypothetical protein